MENKDLILDRLLVHGDNVLITGKSGAGKTYLAREIIDSLIENKVVFAVGGSTGISARNLHNSAKTVHSLLKLGITSSVEEYETKFRKLNPQMAQLIPTLEVLIIEEMSMISAKFWDVIVKHLKRYGFKGVVLGIADFYQLPPVEKYGHNPNYYYCFQSTNWLFYSVVLNETKRTSDKDFIKWSNWMREARHTELSQDKGFLDFLSQANVYKDNENLYVKLFSTNNEADTENLIQLGKLEGEEVLSKGKYVVLPEARKLSNYNWLKEEDFYKNIIPPKDLILKKGCRVMTVVNDKEGNYVNGDLGTVVDFMYSHSHQQQLPLVKIDSTGDEILITPHTFKFEELIGKDYTEVIHIVQLPLNLAYGITVHKSQGLSIDKLSIDCKQFFMLSQLYVAWTRSSDPSQMVVKNFNFSLLMVNNMLIDWFYNEAIPFQNNLIENQGVKFEWKTQQRK